MTRAQRRKRGRTLLAEAERRAFSASVGDCSHALEGIANAAELYGQGTAGVGPISPTSERGLLDEYKAAGNAVTRAVREVKRRCFR